jgi:hypothetical protein
MREDEMSETCSTLKTKSEMHGELYLEFMDWHSKHAIMLLNKEPLLRNGR